MGVWWQRLRPPSAAEAAKMQRLLRQVTAPVSAYKAQVGQGKTAVIILSLAKSVSGSPVAQWGLTALTTSGWETDTSFASENRRQGPGEHA